MEPHYGPPAAATESLRSAANTPANAHITPENSIQNAPESIPFRAPCDELALEREALELERKQLEQERRKLELDRAGLKDNLTGTANGIQLDLTPSSLALVPGSPNPTSRPSLVRRVTRRRRKSELECLLLSVKYAPWTNNLESPLENMDRTEPVLSDNSAGLEQTQGRSKIQMVLLDARTSEASQMYFLSFAEAGLEKYVQST